MLRKRGKIEIVADEDVKGKKRNMGMKLLQNMGWVEGRKIGKNPVTYLEKPMELKPRPKGLGLGATPKEQLINELLGKQETKKRDANKVRANDKVWVVAGKHKGMKGVVLEIDKEYDQLTGARLQHPDLGVLVEINGVAAKLKMKEISRKAPAETDLKKEKKIKKKKKKKSSKESWVRAGLNVRIVSKTFKNGQYYLQKGRVLDKIKNLCFIQLKSGDILQNIPGRKLIK